MENFYLCYIDGSKAYFANDMKNVWGDDWDDRPYEHNAGSPYDHNDVKVTALFFEINVYYELPCDVGINSPYSVAQINKGTVPWIKSREKEIYAGTEMTEFIEAIEEMDGTIFLPKK